MKIELTPAEKKKFTHLLQGAVNNLADEEMFKKNHSRSVEIYKSGALKMVKLVQLEIDCH